MKNRKFSQASGISIEILQAVILRKLSETKTPQRRETLFFPSLMFPPIKQVN